MTENSCGIHQDQPVKPSHLNVIGAADPYELNSNVVNININAGFKSPKKLSIDRAISNFAIKEVDYNIMEMCL